MKRWRIQSRIRERPTAWDRLSQRLEQLAEREGRSANQERIELLGQAMFGDLWAPRPIETAQQSSSHES